ncbi:RNA polymerase sigma factor [uncultured Bacteroides sp.]|uniref:RNA polymerase sigma factor n=1 Tax=uncultured Bacteroides sp. TaxID=162156 RepID=UPI002AA67627|nr:RNA polymerase sigma factor [uncultured Bacteroides sp.]
MNATESEKIEDVYKNERRRLLGYIRKKISDRLDAEDILHDVFYQLTVGFSDIKAIENVTAWLYRVADNRITDLFRKKTAVPFSLIENDDADEDGPISLVEILPALGTSHEEEELKSMIWERIEKTLSELPKEQSSVFIATEFDDVSFKEISEKTGIGVNTLISRKRYAVLALRENLTDLYNLLKE